MNAINRSKRLSRTHDAVIRVYDDAGNVIETHEHAGDFTESSESFTRTTSDFSLKTNSHDSAFSGGSRGTIEETRAVNRIFPKQIANHYRGHKLALWLVYPIPFMNVAIALDV